MQPSKTTKPPLTPTLPTMSSCPRLQIKMLNSLPYALLQVALIFPALASPTSDQESPPDHNDLEHYENTIFIPFLYSFTSLNTPIISGDIAGTSFEFPVDTGSTGLLISASKLPKDYTSKGEPGYQYLDSTNILYVGRYVDTAVTFYGKKPEEAVARLPILVVDESWYCPEYSVGKDKFKCPNMKAEKKKVDDICHLGVGFGRGTAPKYNPFLNVKILNGNDVTKEDFRTGYYIGADGIYLGLTDKNTYTAAWVGLDASHSGDEYDWDLVKTSFTVDSAGPYNGHLLIDTSIAEMLLQNLPSGSVPNTTVEHPDHRQEKIKVVKPGTKLKFGFPSLEEDNVSGYGFTVGDKKFPSQPYFVQAVDGGHGPFVNTGRKFLWGFSIAFDAVSGKLGLICVTCEKEEKEHESDYDGEWAR